MKCLYCGKVCSRKLKFCCRAHRKLHNKPIPKTVLCAGCGSPQRRPKSAISESGIVYCRRCKRASGENHYKWKEGQHIDPAGYRIILYKGKYVREHRVVWEQSNKASLLTAGTIHHIRFDLAWNKTYNDPDNLVLLSDEEHGRLHRLFDAARYEECFEILRSASNRQLHYPREIDNFIQAIK